MRSKAVALLVFGLLVMPASSISIQGAGQVTPEPEARTIQGGGDAIYLGPVLDDNAFDQRLRGHQASSAAGAIDVYNVWPTPVRPKLKANGTIVGHSYHLCNNDASIILGSMIFNYESSIQIHVEHKFSRAEKWTLYCDIDVNLPGYWLLFCGHDGSNWSGGFYKVTSRHNVTRGGSGSGKETAYFDVMTCR